MKNERKVKKGIVRDTFEYDVKNWKSDGYQREWRPEYGYRTEKKHRINARGKSVVWLGVAALAFGVFSNKGLGAGEAIIGHTGTERSDPSMDKEAKAKYESAKKQASPSEQFALRYTDTANVSVNRAQVEPSGILGFLSQRDYQYDPERIYSIEDGCLNDTAYDINGGELHFSVAYSGLFSSVTASAEGDIPTAAAQASYNPGSNILTVRSGNSQPEDLRFAIENTDLRPLDQTTNNLLATYGCEDEVEYSHK